jgi:ATP-dependent DNA helicase RecG
MIDTIGSGIKRIFRHQRERNFPMPDYDLSDPATVKVRLIGRILDERYTRILIRRKDLDILDVIALDKVQKRQNLTDGEYKSLKTKKLIEGRRPKNLYISLDVATAVDRKADYIKNRSFDKCYFKDLIIAYLSKFDSATRKDIDALLFDKVPDVMDYQQKRLFIKNLLQEMRKEGRIKTIGNTYSAKWVLADSSGKTV